MIKTLHPFIMIILLLLTACETQNIEATLNAGNDTYATEVAALQATAVFRSTEVVATARGAETYVAQANVYNQQLLATVRAGDVPTVAVVQGFVDDASVAMSEGDNTVIANSTPGALPNASANIEGIQFTEVGVTSSVRDSDSCASFLETQFTTTTSRIYVTTRALNIRAGTTMRAEWSLGGSLAAQDSYTVPADDADFCLWFVLDSSFVTFTPGSWSVRLFANGTPIDPAVDFTIVGQ
jgi:hypothetical protein